MSKTQQQPVQYVPSKFETAGQEMLAYLKLKASTTNKAVGPSVREAGIES